MKHQHWCGVPAIFASNAAPVLVFGGGRGNHAGNADLQAIPLAALNDR